MGAMRSKLQAFFNSNFYHAFISAVILLNCLVLGLDTSEFIKASGAKWLEIIDSVFSGVCRGTGALKSMPLNSPFSRARIGAGMPLTSSSWL